MKRWMVSFAAVLLLCCLCAVRCDAGTVDTFDDALGALDDSLSDEVKDKLHDIGFSGDITAFGSIGLQNVGSLLLDELARGMSEPLAVGCVILAVLILSSLLEGFTHSLRYTETREVMGAVTSLMIAAAILGPAVGLIRAAVTAASATASLMLLYVPIMIGILAFSGHIVQAGGYYATVMTASQLISQLSARVIPQVMSAYLALSVTSAIGGRLRLKGVCDLLSRLMKWSLALMMTIFTAVLSLQSVTARAGDTVAGRTVRFTLSSLIPIIGSAVSEAYQTIKSSVDLLRTGAGVFVIAAAAVSFLPVLVRTILWLLSVNAARYAAESLGTETPAALLQAVGSVMSVLIAVIVCILSVFLISTAALMRIGGAP